MRKAYSVISFLFSMVFVLSCLTLPAYALSAKIEKAPDRTVFYQGIDWVYAKDGSVSLVHDLDISGTVISCNKTIVEYKKNVTGANMTVKSSTGKWKVGKNTVHIFCDEFGSSIYAVCEIKLSALKSISIVRTPKTKLICGTDWSIGPLNDVEMTKYDLTGTIINALYDDSSTQRISYPNGYLSWSVPDNTNIIMPGNQTLYITFCDKRAAFSVSFITETSFKNGDVSLDGKINSYDALNVLQYSTGSITLSSMQIKLADVDRNSKVNSADALYILQYVVGIKKTL